MASSSATLTLDNVVCLESSKGIHGVGDLKFLGSRLEWRSAGGETKKIPLEEILSAEWTRVSRGCRLRIGARGGVQLNFLNIRESSSEEVELFFKRILPDVVLEKGQYTTAGKNWGVLDVEENAIVFRSDGKRAFEIPLTNVAQCVAQGKNEVSLEYGVEEGLSEIRFYVPNREPTDEDDYLANPNTLVDQISKVADVSSAGDAAVTLNQLPMLVPRGRYDFQMFDTFCTLRGKTYNQKVFYEQIQRLYLLPKDDDVHMYFVMALEPPIRLGQTSYTYLVFNFDLNEEIAEEDPIQCMLPSDRLEELEMPQQLSGPFFSVVATCFKKLSLKKVLQPGSFTTSSGNKCLRMSHKADEGSLFPLDKSFIFLHKPVLFIRHKNVKLIEFSRTADSSRTFEFTLSTTDGDSYLFNNVDRREFNFFESYLKEKNIPFARSREDVESEKKKQEELDAALGIEGSESDEDDGSFASDESSDDDESLVSEGDLELSGASDLEEEEEESQGISSGQTRKKRTAAIKAEEMGFTKRRKTSSSVSDDDDRENEDSDEE